MNWFSLIFPVLCNQLLSYSSTFHLPQWRDFARGRFFFCHLSSVSLFNWTHPAPKLRFSKGSRRWGNKGRTKCRLSSSLTEGVWPRCDSQSNELEKVCRMKHKLSSKIRRDNLIKRCVKTSNSITIQLQYVRFKKVWCEDCLIQDFDCILWL